MNVVKRTCNKLISARSLEQFVLSFFWIVRTGFIASLTPRGHFVHRHLCPSNKSQAHVNQLTCPVYQPFPHNTWHTGLIVGMADKVCCDDKQIN